MVILIFNIVIQNLFFDHFFIALIGKLIDFCVFQLSSWLHDFNTIKLSFSQNPDHQKAQ